MSGHAQRGGLAPLVLVADDEATQRLLTRDRLEREGYRVSEAPDGSAALEMMRTHPPAAVLLDINMPERDGFSVLAEARADSQLADVPIIVVTGLEDTQAIERAFSLQANDFITKPVVWSLLSHRLRFVLRADNMQHMLRDAMVAADAGNKAITRTKPLHGFSAAMRWYRAAETMSRQIPTAAGERVHLDRFLRRGR